MKSAFALPFLASFVALLPATAVAQAPATPRKLQIRFDTTEAAQALYLIEGKRDNYAPVDDDWKPLFATEGYKRLKMREDDMGRTFTDSSFIGFILSDTLGRRAAGLRKTLDAWAKLDVRAAAAKAFAYLPADAHIAATVYIVIKPRTNSFVYDLDRDPAIFIYLDPAESAAERAVWDASIRNFNGDLALVETFFMKVINNQFATPGEISKAAGEFYGVQGPWYTVGWKMAQTIERKYGRAELILCMMDPPRLLSRYNAAAADYNTTHPTAKLAVWSSQLVKAFKRPVGQAPPSRDEGYSPRSARTGSARAARHAGTRAAMTVTSSNVDPARIIALGSVGSTP